MNKNELLRKINGRVNDVIDRANIERAIIESLPDDIDVARTYVSINHTKFRANARGCVELEVQTYDEAIRLFRHPSLEPLDLVKVILDKNDGPRTTSFYPKNQVSQTWAWRGKLEHILPALFQVMPEPGAGRSKKARVYLEWFSYLGQKQEGLPVNVRVTVAQHGVEYVDDIPLTPRNQAHDWRVQNLPDGNIRSIKSMGENGPPYVTIWWDRESVNEPDSDLWLNDVLQFSGPAMA